MQHSTDNSERVFSETGDVSLDILRSVFVHSQFKSKQEEAVKTILQKKDCVVLMPTGGGKTVCYAIPGMVLTGVTIVVSPLIALILDQVQRLHSIGINACYLASDMSDEQRSGICHELSVDCPSYKFLFTTPETFAEARMYILMVNIGIPGILIISCKQKNIDTLSLILLCWTYYKT